MGILKRGSNSTILSPFSVQIKFFPLGVDPISKTTSSNEADENSCKLYNLDFGKKGRGQGGGGGGGGAGWSLLK